MRNKLSLAAVLFGVALTGAPAMAQSYNPATAFSIANGNPNGVWSYGYVTSITAGYSMVLDSATSSSGTVSMWRGNLAGDGNPTVSYNSGATFQSGTVTVPGFSMYMHPGPGGQVSLLRFTAPVAGTYSISALWSGQDSTTTDVHVLVNGVSLADGAINGLGSTSSSGILTSTLAIGGTVDFAVGFGSNGSFGNDSTGLVASVSVPEPGCAIARMLAVPLVVLRRRR